MTKQKSTKRALLMSALALLMCVSMLIGSTFAWFTDTASTAVNKIQSGKLDVVLEMSTDGTNWESAEGKTLTFKTKDNRAADQILWEPGCTYELPQLRVVNKGNLALKYKIQITGIQGDAKLNEVIDWTINDADINLTEGHLTAGQQGAAFTIKGHMQETAGNKYQGLTIDGIGITVVATQDTVENDSVDNQYDKDATYLNTDADGNYLISNANELVYFAKSVNVDGETYAGKTVKLTADIDLAGKNWIPVGGSGSVASYPNKTFSGTFDGDGKTISNMKVNVTGEFASAGLFGTANRATIKNVKISEADIRSTHYAGAILGYDTETTVISGCSVVNSVIASAAENSTGSWDNGDKVGGIVGYMNIADVSNCSVSNTSIQGYRDIGGIIGYIDGGTVSACTINNVTIYVDNIHNYKNYTTLSEHDANDYVGESHVTVSDCNGTANINSLITVSTAEELVALGGTKINGNYILTADIDMTGKAMKSMEISDGAVVNFDGNGHTISNLNLGAAKLHGMTGAGNEVAGLFDLSAPATTVSLTVSDLTVKNATVSCSGFAAAIVGYNSNGGTEITLNNVDVDGATVTADSVAALVAYSTGKVNLNNCDVKGLTLTGEAGRPEKVGAYIGTATTTSCVVTVTNCTNGTTYNNYGRVINGATYNK